MKIKSQIFLYGDPCFCLIYFFKNKKYYTDLLSYRPDPRDYLKKGKKYHGDVYLEEERCSDEVCRHLLRKVIVDGNTFIRIR